MVEIFKQLALGSQTFITASYGYITSLDKDTYTAKVMLEPAGVETGWIPIGTVYAGNSYGIAALPELNVHCLVVFEMGNINSGHIVCFNFTSSMPVPGINQGEIIIQQKSGSSIKMLTDGTVEINATSIKLTGNTPVARQGDAVQVNVPGVGSCTGTITGGSSKVKAG